MTIIITEEAHRDFAILSGDYNPIHMDTEFARQSSFGRRLCHGMHGAMAALEWALASGSIDSSTTWPQSIACQYPRPTYPGEMFDVSVREMKNGSRRLSVRDGNTELLRVTLDLAPRPARLPGQVPLRDARPGVETPETHRLSAEQDYNGSTSHAVDAGLLNLRFPNLVSWIGAHNAAGLALLSTVVGMHWPGLHSLLSEVRMSFGETGVDAEVLNYRTTSSSAEFSATTLQAEAAGFSAEINAFFRPAGVRQLSLADARTAVGARDLRGHRAFVVGGSRGLGEVTVKLLAAAGATVTFSYAHSEQRARDLVNELETDGLAVSAIPLDVRDDASIEKAFSARKPLTQLYYYATPPIFVRRHKGFDFSLLAGFKAIYLDGFLATIAAAMDTDGATLKCFYPSTVAIDEANVQMPEYVVAKQLGEAAIDCLVQNHVNVDIRSVRLNRILTDQTNTIVNADADDPVSALLPVIDSMT